MKRRIALVALLVSVLAAWFALAEEAGDKPSVKIDAPAPDFTLADVEGKTHKLSDYRGKFVALEWHNADCPFVRKHYDSGNMQKLQSQWGKKGVVWLTICSSGPGKQGYYELGDVKKQVKMSKSAASAYLRDTDGKVGRLYSAKTTPHIFVINPDGILIYAGAIDDKPSTKQADIEGATNYVQACLAAATSGKAVATKATTPYGCSVKYAD
ncbi:MAG: thioredoxin family protein [Candidatus Krumholzibacteria bacterium]|nr:thioredoxin family protein [Candidatus Krumholzibacteria bacterium]